MRVLITGITGFAGSHLAEYVLSQHPGTEVYGTQRWRSRTENIRGIESKIQLLECDIRDQSSVTGLIDRAFEYLGDLRLDRNQRRRLNQLARDCHDHSLRLAHHTTTPPERGGPGRAVPRLDL